MVPSSADAEDNILEGKASAWIEGTVPAAGAVLHQSGMCAWEKPSLANAEPELRL